MQHTRFPYMFWARNESCRSAYSLTQSGMPAADPELFAGVEICDFQAPFEEALPRLEKRLAKRFGVAPEQVLVTSGTSGALHLLAMRFFPGARVVTETPSYGPFRALPELYRADLRVVERRHEHGWRLPTEAVQRELGRGEGPAHLYLCNPHNPTSTLLPRDELLVLAAAAAESGGVFLSDEVYMEFAPDESAYRAHALAPNGISIGSFTKAYGLGPIRVGWIVLGAGLVEEREALLDLNYLVAVDVPTPSLRLGLAALDLRGQLLAPYEELAATSRPHLESWLERTEGVEGTLGPIGLCCFPRLAGVQDTFDLREFLAREHDVDITPGEFFGHPGYVRIGFGLPADELLEGLSRFGTGLERYRRLH